MSELTEEQEKTGRLFLRLPKESIEEISKYIARSGVSRAQFLAMAMVLGARALDRGLYPQAMMTPSLIEQMSASMMQEFTKMNPETLSKIFASMPEEK